MRYLIYSREHRMWWRENSAGYTLHMDEAGAYDYAKALAICANLETMPDGTVHEFVMAHPDDAAELEAILSHAQEAIDWTLASAELSEKEAAALTDIAEGLKRPCAGCGEVCSIENLAICCDYHGEMCCACRDEVEHEPAAEKGSKG